MTTAGTTRVDAPADLPNSLDWDKSDGLLPAIVQHAHDGRVLMLGYCDREALERTMATGEMHFRSRSRRSLWRKGETSGNTLRVISIAPDCDSDTLLCQAVPAGPTCHHGTSSCFDGGTRAHPWLNELEALVASRRKDAPADSYVAGLLAAAPSRRAQKVGEEGVETALAAVSGDRDALTGEAADLLFHLVVLLQGADISVADVVKVLADRHRGA